VVLLYMERYPQVLQDGIVVNISARFDMSKTPTSRFSAESMKQLEHDGKFLWKKWTLSSSLLVPLDGQDSVQDLPLEYFVTQQALEERGHVKTEFKLNPQYPLRVYTIHGEADEIIPFSDAQLLDSYFKQQVKDNQLDPLKFSHQVIPVEDCDHFYTGKYNELISIVDYLLTQFYQ